MTRTYPIIKMTIAGTEYVWQDTDIVEARAIQEVHPIAIELPMSTLDFTIYTTNPQFSIFSDGGLYSQLSEGQVVRLYEYIDGIQVFVNEYYLDDWKHLDANTIQFRAIDLIGRLENMQYDGGFWSSLTGITTILHAFLDTYGVLFFVDGMDTEITLKGWIPPGTVREALQQVCFAAGMTAHGSIDGFLILTPAVYALQSSSVDLTVPDGDKRDDQTVDLLPLVTGVDLILHDYLQGAVSETIFSQTLAPGSYKVIFNKPYYSVSVTGVGYIPYYLVTESEDFLITEGGDFLIANGEYIYGPNSIMLTVFPPGGAVEVTGYPWVDSKQSYLAMISSGNRSNDLKIEEATLVNGSNKIKIANYVKDYYRRRYRHRFTLLNYNTPTAIYGLAPVYGTGLYSANGLQVGHVIHSNMLTKSVLGVAEKLEYDLTGGFRIALESVGIERAPIV